ncbi:MAG: hypothetical protein Q8K30_01450 [Candidatus Gracilibacteria bacterium]|nr:hypothetical protein [Candidatus Gracilibacteria bacterium]
MKNKGKYSATSIVEAMIVMLIIVTGVTGMYKLLSESNKLTVSVKNKIQAVQIARQGIEGFTNIRDTNWILFSSDYANCWNTYNYDSDCIGNDLEDTDIKSTDTYKIYLNNENRWELKEDTGVTTFNYSDNDYRNFFKVGLDNGIFTQSGGTVDTKPLYTREIKVEYPNTGSSNESSLKITSVVQWSDSSSTVPYKLEIEQTLTNWKSKK